MNIYALFPLVAIVAYIPLLITTISRRPWRRQQRLLVLFLTVAILWSLSDLILRGDFLRQHNFLLGKLVIFMFTGMAVQLHIFVSSFFPVGRGRWLPVAYVSIAVAAALTTLGYVPEEIVVSGSKLYIVYGASILFLLVPLITLLARDVYVFWKMLKALDNPVLHSQIMSLLLTICVLTVFSFAALLPWGREFPVIRFGGITAAFILSYATVRHQLVDIKFVLQRGSALVTLVIIGIASYGLLLAMFSAVFRFESDLTAMVIATATASLVIIFIYRLRCYLLVTMGKIFPGQSDASRQELSDYASKIQDVFSLEKQGGTLLALATKAIGCKRAGLLFLDASGEDFAARLVEPKSADNPMSGLRLSGQNPIVEYLRQEQKLLTRESLAILPEFRSLGEEDRGAIDSSEIALFVPLISRDRLIGILVLDKKQAGRYSLEDFHLLEDVANRVAVSMEKEYLREQLTEREEDLSVINRASTIITSSLDIQGTYESFIDELKRVVDVSWAAIILNGEKDAYFLALASEIGSSWQAGERVPLQGTATEWVVNHKKSIVESDLAQESQFVTGGDYLKQGVRSIVYLPLIAKGKAIGSLNVASCRPCAYSQRYIMLLKQLAYQVAMHIEHSRLYAEVEEQARIDKLTGLLNRRSLDEVMASEISRHSRYGGVFSLIIFDLDSFKAFNDNHGHLAGDKLLEGIGRIMKSSIRSADQAFRYGGDEFALLLPNTLIDAADRVAERVRKQVAARVKPGYIPVTASLGIASWPADGIGANEVIATADAALYHAKRNGGNRSHCASGTLLPLGEVMDSAEDAGDSEALNTIYTLAATVDARNDYSQSHWKKVKAYATTLARALNLEPLEIKKLETCALLHDIGKIGISDKILSKRGKLTDEEWEAIKAHSQVGANIVSHARQLATCLPGILHHHERYDGSGYPQRLKGEDIPLDARILAVADAFAAMTSDRPYSDALPLERALGEIRRGAGTQFDPRLVEAFLFAVDDYPVVTTGEGRGIT